VVAPPPDHARTLIELTDHRLAAGLRAHAARAARTRGSPAADRLTKVAKRELRQRFAVWVADRRPLTKLRLLLLAVQTGLSSAS
jgi:hypothetical protein